MVDRRIFLVPESLATQIIGSLDRLVSVTERVNRLRMIGYDEADLPFEAASEAVAAWNAVRTYAAERSVAGGMIVAIPVPGHPDDEPVHLPDQLDDARMAPQA